MTDHASRIIQLLGWIEDSPVTLNGDEIQALVAARQGKATSEDVAVLEKTWSRVKDMQ